MSDGVQIIKELQTCETVKKATAFNTQFTYFYNN